MPRFFVVLLIALWMASPASAQTKTAVFPFDMHDLALDDDPFAKLKAGDVKRLVLVADELKALMAKDGAYQVIDLTPFAKEVDDASPYDKCDACEVPIAKKAGADLAVTGFVEKVSDALMSLRIFARDAETGKLVKSMSATVQGNTDELWLHGIRWLWKNRFNAQPLNAQPQSETGPK